MLCCVLDTTRVGGVPAVKAEGVEEQVVTSAPSLARAPQPAYDEGTIQYS